MIEVPEDALEERFLAATGPGGQNVNKVATACQLRVDVFRLRLHPETYRRLKLAAGSRLTAAGVLVLTARRYRTQEANRADARARLAARGRWVYPLAVLAVLAVLLVSLAPLLGL